MGRGKNNCTNDSGEKNPSDTPGRNGVTLCNSSCVKLDHTEIQIRLLLALEGKSIKNNTESCIGIFKLFPGS